ncbi:T9SS type A sorting domain-containing protein [uncultured Microscilla sp.]|uniref:T9SS type A sorting domain-containing protein n=1 Tax=uncultured Microscilla sp. TaxID=432653 RepID=UPI00262E00C4|nr:T9SS type A sorting domain-containing protein [uncultured Microscilla sp.]
MTVYRIKLLTTFSLIIGLWVLTTAKTAYAKSDTTAVKPVKYKPLTVPDLQVEISPGVWRTLPNGTTTIVTLCSAGSGGRKLRTTTTGTTYEWKGLGGTTLGTNAEFTAVNGFQIHTVTVDGVESTAKAQIKTVSSSPSSVSISASSTSICSGGNTTLTATATGEIDAYRWYKNGVLVETNFNNSYNVSAAGVYTVEAVNDCNATLSTNSVTITIVGAPPSNVNVAAANTEQLVCNGSGTLLTVTASGDNLNYAWSRNGVPEGTNSATHLATGAGTYKVVVSNGCGNDDATIVMQDADKPGSIFINQTSASTFCGALFPRLSAGANLSPGSTVSKYEWYRDGTLVKTSANSSDNEYTPSLSGNYTVKVYNFCGGTTSSVVTITSINPPTYANIKSSSPPSLGCGVTSLVLSVDTDGDNLKYVWKKDNVVAGTSATLNVTTSGDYQVEIQSINPLDNSVCGAQTSAVVNIPFVATPPTTIAMTSTQTITCDGKIELTATSDGDGLSYNWFKDGVAVATTLTNTYNATLSGAYTVQAQNACGNGPLSNAISLDIKSVPNTISITASDTLVCGTGTVTLTGNVSGSGLVLEWFLNNQKKGEGASLNVTETGEYLLRVTSAECGVKEAKKLIRFVVAPSNVSIIPGSATNVCDITKPVTLFAQFDGTEGTYEWFKDGILVGNTATYNATEAGSYALRVDNECGNAISTNNINITFGGALTTPGLLIQNNGGSNILCNAVSIQLKATQSEGTVQYRWFKDNKLVNNANGEVLEVSDPGEYRVEISKQGCSALSLSQVIQSNEQAPPILGHLTPLEFCQGDSVVLSTEILDANAKYEWLYNGNVVSSGSSYTAKDAGIYTIRVTNSCGFSNTRQAEVEVKSPPEPQVILSNNRLSVLTADIRKYQWYFNGTPIIGANDETFIPIDSGNYFVNVTTSVGCEGTSNVINFQGLDINANPLINIAPNPTNTGRVTVTILSGLDAHLKLYNNRGKVVYSNSFPKNTTFVNQKLVEIGELPRGIYLLKASFGNGQSVSTKILVY